MPHDKVATVAADGRIPAGQYGCGLTTSGRLAKMA